MRPSVFATALVSLAALFGHTCIAASAETSREAQLKAAYIFNFIKFVEWPSTRSSDNLEICFLGAQDVLDAFSSATAEKTVGTRGMNARSISKQKGNGSVRCDVLYVDSSEDSDPKLAVSEPTLTIGDARDFTRAGGIVRLYMDNNRLRFAINVENAKRARLQVSSNLLKLATQVEQGAGS